jgi:hypothetical protein
MYVEMKRDVGFGLVGQSFGIIVPIVTRNHGSSHQIQEMLVGLKRDPSQEHDP